VCQALLAPLLSCMSCWPLFGWAGCRLRWQFSQQVQVLLNLDTKGMCCRLLRVSSQVLFARSSCKDVALNIV
jgi:hypothetical protein